MSIRSRLALAFLAILSLFALNIVVYYNGIGQRTASFEDLNQAVQRQFLVVDLQRQVASLTDVVRNLHLLAQADLESAFLETAQVEEKLRELQGLSQMARRLASMANQPTAMGSDVDPRNPAADAETVRRLSQGFSTLEDVWGGFFQCLTSKIEEESEETATETDRDTAPAPLEAIENTEATEASAAAGCSEPQLALAQEITGLLDRLQVSQRQQVEVARSRFSAMAEVTNRRILSIFAVSALVAFVVALVFSAQLSRGLTALKSGARRIGQGDLQHRIPSRGGDELAELARTFNDMSVNLLTARSKVEEARAAAEDANRAKSTFLANMSHELRTPMNAIIGYSEMLIEEAEDLQQEDFIPDLQRILTASNHLLALINDVLDLSKIEAGKMTLFLEDIAITSLVDDVSATIRPLVAKQENRLELALAPNLGILRADETKLRQTLFNLLSNACKFTTAGTIRLQAERYATADGDRLRFRVTDTGIGMSDEQMQRIFDEFTQADSSTTRQFGGTGLGLSISKRFCELMAGQLTVDSRLGAGTTFTIDLPAVVPDPEAMIDGPTTLPVPPPPNTSIIPASGQTSGGEGGGTPGEGVPEGGVSAGPGAMSPAASDPEAHAWQLRRQELFETLHQLTGDRRGPGHVLIVDDNDEDRQRLRGLCQARGWSVSEAANGLVALAMLPDDPPDAILLDLSMPQMDGFEFLRQIRGSPELATLPVVVLTEIPLQTEEAQRLEGLAEAVLDKMAFDLRTLRTAALH